ncbi:MAG: isochorismatase family protein [Devosia sp.]
MSVEGRTENYRGVFDKRVGFGTRPLVLVVDFINAYTKEGSPFYAEGVVHAVAQSEDLVAAARASKVPVVYTKVLFHESGMDGGHFVRKVPALKKLVAGEPLADIVPSLAPHPGDLVLVKNYASAFFGTTLAATMTAMGVDTLILIGCSTSGCIRATAVDGMQYGFRVIVPETCVGDRHDDPHSANLFDINAKYGDVCSREEVIAYLNARSATSGAAAGS